MAGLKHYRIRVAGKVQGVFFRHNTRQKAVELGIKGIVRNEPDGSVYIEAEGDSDALAQFLAWCKEGPPLAEIAGLKMEDGTIKKYHTFEIEG